MLASIGAACARCSPVAAGKAAEPALHVCDRAICPASLTVLQSLQGPELAGAQDLKEGWPGLVRGCAGGVFSEV
jgi:hypothetical protein